MWYNIWETSIERYGGDSSIVVKYVFKKTESHYVGYALFTPNYLANLQYRLRIYPVKAGLNDHCGMFFLGKDKKIVCDDLTIRPYTLRTLRSLCDLLQANVVLK